MQTAKPHYIIPRAQDNGPTPERAVKSVFTRGNPPRVLTTVQSLLNAGDISQDDANAGERWYRDYIFAYEGIIEFPDNHVSDTTVRHDAVSWNVTRAVALDRILDVRDALGERANQILRMMLVDELSFRQIGETFFPRLNATVARGKMSAQCSMLLQQLSGFYQMQKRRKEKTCTPHAVSV
ncbi:hypothetical protein FKW31_03000 [Acetobacter sp. DmW_136]|uniref:hypothetical protein n=1 Tax=Acetobacter sp. DmW_136 TaxID=2591091 RepID=UPI00123C346A|nr:hypothetical protein [Acetobacter sp. DmW_136]KAA8387629.1 hypothetical protein FKW31_03000 [Acetobacter sp. DmW_136]